MTCPHDMGRREESCLLTELLQGVHLRGCCRVEMASRLRWAPWLSQDAQPLG